MNARFLYTIILSLVFSCALFPYATTARNTPPIQNGDVVEKTFSFDTPASVYIGKETYEVVVREITHTDVTFTIQPMNLKSQTPTLKKESTKYIDINRDGVSDMQVEYVSLIHNKPTLKFTNLINTKEINSVFTVDAGAFKTTSSTVILFLNLPSDAKIAISNTSDFSKARFASSSPKILWHLSPGLGVKTVYIKAKLPNGKIRLYSDTIKVIKDEQIKEKILTTDIVYTHPRSGISFSNVSTPRIMQGGSVTYKYIYKNTMSSAVKVTAREEVLTRTGTVVFRKDKEKVLQPHASISDIVQQSFSESFPIGAYIIRVRIFDSHGNVLDKNGFEVNVEKRK